MALSDSSCLFIFNPLATYVVRTWCSSRTGLALCALSTPCCKSFFIPSLFALWDLRASSLFVWPSISNPLTHVVRFKIVIDSTSLKPAYVEYPSSCIIVQSYSQNNVIYWDEVALDFFLCCNYSQETLSNALSDHTKY